MKLFTNWSNEDFAYTFNSNPFEFKVNSSTELEDGIADHFAYHLAVRELSKVFRSADDPMLQEFISKCFGSSIASEIETSEPIVESIAEELKEEPEEEAKEEVKEEVKPIVKAEPKKKIIKKKANF